MSDRDDIDVVKTAENSSADETIRQNYPIDNDNSEGGSKKKLGFFEKVKKILSTDDDEPAGSEPETDDSMFSTLLGRFKKSEENAASDTPGIEQTNEKAADPADEQPETAPEPVPEEKPQPEKESDPAEEEELLMIDAFLSGEEYIPPKDEAPDLSGAFDEEEVVFVDFDTDDDDASEVSGDDQAESENKDEAAEESGEADAAADDSMLSENTENTEQADNSESETAEKAAEEGEAALDEQIESENIENAEASDEQNDAGSGEDKREEAIEDDEEFVLEEDKPFDEDDDVYNAEQENTDDFGDISSIFEDKEEKEKRSQVPVTKEYEAEPIDLTDGDADNESDIAEGSDGPASEEKTEEKDEPASEEKAEEKDEPASEEKTEEKDEHASEEKTEEKDEHASEEKAEEKDEHASEEKAEEKDEPASEEKAEEKDKHASEEKTEEKEEPASEKKTEEKEEPASEEKTENKPGNSAKVFFGRVKNKLAELWNAKSEQETAAKKGVIAAEISDEKQEEKPAGVSEEKQEEKPAEVSEEKQEEKPAEVSEEKQEEKPAEVTEEKQEEKPAEVTEEKQEEKPAEDSEEKQEEKPAGVSEEKQEEKPAESSEDKAEEQTERRTPMISVIKNENVTKSDFDEEKLREKLNVIERTAADVLTDEQRREIEESKRELERVSELEKQSKAEQEELRRETERRKAREAAESSKIVTELDVGGYHPENRENVIRFATGRFSESVRAEYECIINYNRMKSVSADENLLKEIKKVEEESSAPAAAPKQESEATAETDNSTNEILKEAREYERNHDKVESLSNKLDYQDSKNPEPVEYRTEEDAAAVKKHLSAKRKKYFLTFSITAVLTIAAFIFSMFASRFTVGAGAEAAAGPQRAFAAINLLLYGGAVFCCRDIVISGLLPLKKFKANSDTGAALACAAAALQALLSLIAPKPFMTQGLNVYTLVVMLALTLFAAGRYLNADRASANFRFVSDSEQKYAGKFFTDARTVAKLLSGTKNEKTEFSFQKKTAFLSHFMRLSNAEDPGDRLASTFSLASLIAALFAALIAGIMAKSFFDAVSVLCIMLCAGIPISSRLLGAWPLRRLARSSLLNRSMVVGYPAVETFSESAAVMIDAKDLYPAGSIEMVRTIRYDNLNWQNGVYGAAALTLAAGGAVSSVFEQLVRDNGQMTIPRVEGVMYEDNKGLLGWVNGQRVLVGNRYLLLSHAVPVVSEAQDKEYKADGDEPLYIAYGQKLVGVITVRYSASRRVSDTLKRMEASGMSLLVRTTDVNITAERISSDFGVNNKNIKVLEQKVFNYIRDEMVGKERVSPAYIATKGGVTSFGLAVSECVQTKRDISLSTAVEIAGTLVKMLIICAIVLFAGIHQIGAVQIFVFSLLWAAVVLFAPTLVQKIQGLNK